MLCILQPAATNADHQINKTLLTLFNFENTDTMIVVTSSTYEQRIIDAFLVVTSATEHKALELKLMTGAEL